MFPACCCQVRSTEPPRLFAPIHQLSPIHSSHVSTRVTRVNNRSLDPSIEFAQATESRGRSRVAGKIRPAWQPAHSVEEENPRASCVPRIPRVSHSRRRHGGVSLLSLPSFFLALPLFLFLFPILSECYYPSEEEGLRRDRSSCHAGGTPPSAASMTGPRLSLCLHPRRRGGRSRENR